MPLTMAACDSSSISPNVVRRSSNMRFCAYFLIAVSGILLFIGIFMALYVWNYLWLIVSAVGIALLIVGTVTHACSDTAKRVEKRSLRDRHKNHPVMHPTDVQNRNNENENLLPSAPLNNVLSSSSQSCLLSMFGPNIFGDVSSASVAAPPYSEQNYNRITLNGQNFLLVPVPTEASTADTSNVVVGQISQSGYTVSIPPPSNVKNTTASVTVVPSVVNVVETILMNNENDESDDVSESQTTALQSDDSSTRQLIPIDDGNETADCIEHQLYVTIISDRTNDEPREENAGSANELGGISDNVDSSSSSLDLSSASASTIVDTLCSSSVLPSISVSECNSVDTDDATVPTTNQLSDASSALSSASCDTLLGAVGGCDTSLNVINCSDSLSISDDDSIGYVRSTPPPSYDEVALEEGFTAV